MIRKLLDRWRKHQEKNPNLFFWLMSLPALIIFLVGVVLLLINLR